MDKLQVFKLALSAAGTKNSITSPDENSREGRTCSLWYDLMRDWVLRAAPWPSAFGVKRLALQVEKDTDEDWVATDPAPGWLYAYAAPDDMLAPRYLKTGADFSLVSSVNGEKQIATNDEETILFYTRSETVPDNWDVHLQMAIIYALAAQISLPLEGKIDRARELERRANDLILQARVSAANTNYGQLETVPDWLSARGVNAAGISRYIYPLGPLVNVS